MGSQNPVPRPHSLAWLGERIYRIFSLTDCAKLIDAESDAVEAVDDVVEDDLLTLIEKGTLQNGTLPGLDAWAGF